MDWQCRQAGRRLVRPTLYECVRVAFQEGHQELYRPPDPPSDRPGRLCRPLRVGTGASDVVRLHHAVDLEPVLVRRRHSCGQGLADPVYGLRTVPVLEHAACPEGVPVHVSVVQPVHPPHAEALQLRHHVVKDFVGVDALQDVVREVNGGGEKECSAAVGRDGVHGHPPMVRRRIVAGRQSRRVHILCQRSKRQLAEACNTMLPLTCEHSCGKHHPTLPLLGPAIQVSGPLLIQTRPYLACSESWP